MASVETFVFNNNIVNVLFEADFNGAGTVESS